MLKPLLLLIFVTLSAGAQAEVFICKKANGDTEFSDTPCKAGASSELLPDRDPLTQKQKDEAQQKLQQQTKEVNERGAQRAATQAADKRAEPALAKPAAPSPDAAVDDGEAITTCASDGRRNSNCAPKPRPPRNPRPVPRPN